MWFFSVPATSVEKKIPTTTETKWPIKKEEELKEKQNNLKPKQPFLRKNRWKKNIKKIVKS